ncbi:MAG: twin-arginine translocase TatA/TatE family subunit [Muribaculaceae bacterium]|nr:twin-arginine translocase TatA/TatE family subunit [Muribaculaceae bacterium]
MILGLFGNLGTGELLLIGFIVLLLFGGKKLPELMQGLGKGVRGFKKGLNDVKEEIDRPVDTPDDKEEAK